MFSILICSVNAVYLEKLKINISETIGTEYELIIWNNLADPKPISEAYNLLAAKAKYPYYCFIHEDILFQTDNWSVLLQQAFDKNPETGLIGIAGSKYKSRTPSGWSTGIQVMDCCNIFHKGKNGETVHLYNNPAKTDLASVANIDGVFIAIRKEVWRTASFNTQLLRGFHLYDIDISFQVLKHWKAAVIFSIDILHFTEGGNFGNEWISYTLKWHKLFKNQLPQLTENIHLPPGLENTIAKNWLYRLRTEEITLGYKWRWIIASGTWRNPTAWPYIGIFLFGKNYRAKN